MDNGLLNSTHGQAAVGWLVFEDLLTVLILVLIPSLAGAANGFDWQGLGLTLLKAALFVLLLLFLGAKMIPWLLMRIVHTRSRELFILAVLVIALGTALGAAELFGVSLALGAFVAGVVVSESPLSHQVGADLFPFRETFAVLFFVSIGMLANPVYLVNNIGPVLALTALVVIGKPVITLLLGLLFPWPARTSLVVAAGLSQIGEFSFILGQAGLTLGLLDKGQYSLILVGALLSITVNPMMFRFVDPLERAFRRFLPFWRMLDRHGPAPAPLDGSISGHVVIVGYGRVGGHIVAVLGQTGIPHLVVETDAERTEELDRRNIPTLFGDAANSEVLKHTGLKRARALVVTVPDESAAEMIVASARQIAPGLPIIVRAATEAGVKRLGLLGAQYVIHPELEGGLEIVRHMLLQLGFPLREVCRYADAVRNDHYDLQVNTEKEHRLLHDLLSAVGGIEISWFHLPPGHPLIGKTLAQADLRSRTGGSVVAIRRNGRVTANPISMTVFAEEDRVGLTGDTDQIEKAERVFALPETAAPAASESRNNEPDRF